MLGSATGFDVQARTLDWDQLFITSGSVHRLLSIPGVTEHAMGLRSISEALYLRDHVLWQLELAEMTNDPDQRDPHYLRDRRSRVHRQLLALFILSSDSTPRRPSLRFSTRILRRSTMSH